MKITKRLAGLVSLSATAAVLVVGVGPVQAAPALGAASLTPTTGNANSVLNVSTATGLKCPTGASGVIADLTGPGIDAGAGNNVLQGFTDISLAQNATSLNVPIGSKFFDVFQANGVVAPSGTYTLRLVCLGSDNFTGIGEYIVPVVFTAATGSGSTFNGTYVAEVPATATSSVLSGPASSTFGASVTLTADVDPSAAGSFQFKDGSTNLGGPRAVDASGVASFTTSSLSVGSHNITAVFTPTSSAFTASTSNALTHVVGAVTTALTLTGNGPTAQFSPATFTSTVSPVVAGSVLFKDGTTTLGTVAVNGSGVATFSTAALAVGSHQITAIFTPSASGGSGSSAPTLTHVVTAATIAPVNQNIVVTVPTGSLTIVLDSGADGLVDLGEATLNGDGDLFTAAGQMDPVKVTDTRAGDLGWTASGVVTDFTQGANAINGFNLGWTPRAIALSAHQTGFFNPGGPVVAGAERTAASVPANAAVGLESPRVLGSAPALHGNGTARLGARLDLNIPTDVPAAVYNAVLTLTVL